MVKETDRAGKVRAQMHKGTVQPNQEEALFLLPYQGQSGTSTVTIPLQELEIWHTRR